MYHPIRTAIASYGMSGQVFHGPSLKVNQGFNVLAVFERTKNISSNLFPDARIVRSFDEILHDTNIELVIINTPDALHFEMAKNALKAGKHIVVEKPVTQKSIQAEELIEMAKKQGLTFTVYQNRRFDGDFLTVQKVIQSGKLGRIIEFESHYDRYRTFITPETWKEEKDEFGGVLYNLGSHMVDQAYVLFGKPGAVTAHLRKNRKGTVVTDYYDIRLEYDSFSAILKCSYLVKDPGPRYTIYGEYGTYRKWGIDPQEELLKAGNLPEGDDWGAEPETDWGNLVYEKDGKDHNERIETIPGDYRIFYNNLYESIRNKADLLINPEETVEVLRILETCIKSDRLKKTILL